MKSINFAWFFIFNTLLSNTLLSQNLRNHLSQYQEYNARQYIKPLTDMLGHTLNSGYYHTSNIPPTGFHLKLSMITMLAPVHNSQKTFQVRTDATDSIVFAPTIFGEKEASPYPGGFDMRYLQINILQLNIASIAGTEFTIRFANRSLMKSLNKKAAKYFGDFKLFCIGVRHLINRYIPDTPVSITIGYYLNTLRIEEYFSSESIYGGIQVSYPLKSWTLYGGLAMESTRSAIKYRYHSDPTAEEIYFERRDRGPFSLTIGISMDIAILTLHGEYKIASQKVFSTGLGIGF